MHETQAKSILSSGNGMNIYRGCSHGCIYCDARSKCYNMQHDFEDIEIKANAVELLEQTLRSRRNRCMISTGAMSDPYMHVEEKLCHTRRCLELIHQYGFGLAIQTKSDRILRDLDLLKKIHTETKCVVQITLTTYDENLCKLIEPNVCTTKRRVEVLNILREEGIPTVVWMTPILPFINDSEKNIRGLLDYCIEAKVYGILTFQMGLTLREGDREYYYSKLDKYFPGMKEKYIKYFGNDYILPSPNSKELLELVRKTCNDNRIVADDQAIFEYMRAFEDKKSGQQINMFDFMPI